MSVLAANRVCKICGTSGDFPIYIAREMMFGFRDEFEYFQCTNCQCLQIGIFPANMKKYYPANYYSLSAGEGEGKASGLKKYFRSATLGGWVFNRTWIDRFFQAFYVSLSLRVLRDLGVDRDTRILDVGCGTGQKFLSPLANLGFKNLLGCDPFLSGPVTHPNGLRILNTDVFGIKGKWDVITYHHVFEHVSDPLANLQKVHELLDDTGTCILRMPTVSSFAWKHYGTNWVQLDAPRHFFLHSVESIRHLAEKCGFFISRIEYDSTYKQFADSERYVAGRTLKEPRPRGFKNFIKRKIEKFRFNRLAAEMNKKQQGDQAAFFLKKNPGSDDQ